MGYQSRTSKFLVLLTVAVIFGQKIYSQQCVISATEFSPIYIKNLGKIQDLYSEMKLGESFETQLVYIKFLSQVNKVEAFYLGVNKDYKIEMKAMTPDSILFSKCIDNNGKYNFDFLASNSSFSGYYASNCSNIVSSHQRSILMVYDNARKRWIEFTSMDGYMEEALAENSKYKYFKDCYELIEKIFKDFDLTYTK
jgi:hypothetical protein